jgi:uncharacterized protein
MKTTEIIIGIVVILSIITGIIMLSSDNQKIDTHLQAFFPEPSNYVVDPFGILQTTTVNSLNQSLRDFDGKAQIAVAIVKTTKPYSIEEYGIRLAENWKVGYQGKDNGVILILAYEDRKVRIEVGKGIEGDIPDAVAGRIIDESMIPSLKNNDWDTAVNNGVEAIKNKLTK